MERYWGIFGERVVSVMRSSVFADWCLLKSVRLLSSHRAGETALSLLMISFQKDGSRFWRKTILGCKTGKRMGQDLYLKGAEKRFEMVSFLK